MKKAIVVFKSKTEVFRFMEEIRSRGAAASTVGTPAQAKIGCGISVKIDYGYLPLAKKIIAGGGYGAFYGIYAVTTAGGRTETVKIM